MARDRERSTDGGGEQGPGAWAEVAEDATMMRALVEAAPDAIILVDARGVIASVNRAAETMFGYAREELLGSPIELLVPERVRVEHTRQRAAYTGGPRMRAMGHPGLDLVGRRKDGSTFPADIALSPLETERGRFVVSVVRDRTERRRAEAKFEALLSSAPDGIVVVDAEGRIAIVNSEAERMFGYARSELIGQPVEMLVPERYRGEHVDHRRGYSGHPTTRPMGAGRELTGRKRDGTELPVEISLSPLETEQGVLVTAIIRDITERRHAEAQIKASLHEKEVLLKEIHHRVKNNLQVTSSLLRLQSAHIQDRAARQLFADSQNRIRSMALVHEKLYQSTNLSRIDLADYTRSLATLLFRSYAVRDDRVQLELRGDGVSLGIHRAVPTGLILNELLSNALKHAFPPNRRGRVIVTIGSDPAGQVAISVADDGIGLPLEFDITRTSSLGLQLVRTLSDQLRATLEVRRPEVGTEFRISFPETRT